MDEIISFIREGISQLEEERYLDTEIIPTNSVNFFDYFNRETSIIQLSKAQYINCRVDNIDGKVWTVKITNENFSILVDQYASMAKEMMLSCNLIDSFYEANRIVEKVGTEKCDPDLIPQFKNYIENGKNEFKSFFEIYLHPIAVVASIPNAISTKIVRKCVKKERDIVNINKFYNFVYSNMLCRKQFIYRSFLKGILSTYSDLKEVLDTKSNCMFKVDICGISNIQQIRPKDSLGSLYDCLLRMSQVIIEGSNSVSFDVFQSVNTIYNQFLTECKQRNITKQGIEAINECKRG